MNSSTKEKKITLIEEPLEFEDFTELKLKKRPYNPYRSSEVCVPSNWGMLENGKGFHRAFSTVRIERFRQKIERDFFCMMKESCKVSDRQQSLENSDTAKGLSQEETYVLVEKAIKQATTNALKNQPPPIMSPSHYTISLNILELLANLYNIETPTRKATDKHSEFLIYIADWTAKITCNAYCNISPDDDDDDYRIHSPSSKLSVAETRSVVKNIPSIDVIKPRLNSMLIVRTKSLEDVRSPRIFSPISVTPSCGSQIITTLSKNTTVSRDCHSTDCYDTYTTTESTMNCNIIKMNTHQCVHDTSELSSSVAAFRKKKKREKYFNWNNGGIRIVHI